MSRAPAPMKNDTAASAPTDFTNTNPYNMQTFGMVPNASSLHTDASVHAMQNMYGNMQAQQQQQQFQQQQLQQQQQMQMQMAAATQPPGYMGNTTQNVSVVDFKPDVMAQQHMADMQNKYQQHVKSMTDSQTPASIGLVGRDGRYIPATAARPTGDPYGGSRMDPYNPYPHTDTYAPRHNYPNNHTNTSYNSPYPRVPHTMSHAGMKNLEVQRRSNAIASSLRSQSNMQPRVAPSPATSTKAMTALIDERIGSHASAVSAAKNASTVSSRALSDMIDERLHVAGAKNASTTSPVVSEREIKSLIDQRVRKIVPKYTASPISTASVAPTIPSTASDFHTKSPTVQRKIVSDAVHDVMSEYKKNDPYTAGQYTPRDRKGTSSYVSSNRDRMLPDRYAR